MRILITGNMGYVGPSVVRQLRNSYPRAVIDGYDTGYFSHCLTIPERFPERLLDHQTYADVRTIKHEDVEGYDVVIMLAAISNDPMGARFAHVTGQINQDAAITIANIANDVGVRNLVFASSCSVYGFASGQPRNEQDPVNPLTAYAASKIGTENALAEIKGAMTITSLRFATACGMADRLRLDLALNDFVAGALTLGEISILSDGTPWRPLIDVADMALAIEWAATRSASNGGRNLVVNAGHTSGNYQVRDLAEAVSRAVPGCEVSINRDAPADSRSYKVDFGLFASLAPDFVPRMRLENSITALITGLKALAFTDRNYRQSRHFIRLESLKGLMAQGHLSERLTWSARDSAPSVFAKDLAA
ncbi:NAD-dependent epimerase/dehydratase family protein [Sphingomonas sp. R86520]|uniref:NAD-dependent epimerase/dehydratase family protein n=1 Tax=Sphingomonas sp. R86520 TaxID=3093859 RepID=UPI0036D3D8EB